MGDNLKPPTLRNSAMDGADDDREALTFRAAPGVSVALASGVGVGVATTGASVGAMVAEGATVRAGVSTEGSTVGGSTGGVFASRLQAMDAVTTATMNNPSNLNRYDLFIPSS